MIAYRSARVRTPNGIDVSGSMPASLDGFRMKRVRIDAHGALVVPLVIPRRDWSGSRFGTAPAPRTDTIYHRVAALSIDFDLLRLLVRRG